MTPTKEQQAFVDCETQCAKLIAWAGTGKTATFVERSLVHPERTLYLAFNKSVEQEAKQRFPSHVLAKTTHALAYAAIIGGSGKYTLGKLSIFKTSKLYRLDFYMASLVHKTIENFCNSADFDMTKDHVAPDTIGRYENDITDVVLDFAKKVWAIVLDGKNPDFPMPHSGYLKLYQLSEPVLHYGTIMLDEAQDTNPVTQDIVLRQAAHGARILLAGDPYQQIYCQPAGTMVTVVERPGNGKTGPSTYKKVPIEQVTVGTKLAGYNLKNGYAVKTGERVAKVGQRHFNGLLVEITAGALKSNYTGDHHCVVRIGDTFLGKHIVYLMRRGTSYRIGRTTWRNYSQHSQIGCLFRAKQEKADAFWVLDAYDTKEEAALAELDLSWQHGVPSTTFSASKTHILGQDGLNEFWVLIGDNSDRAEGLLEDMGLDIRYPFWTKNSGNLLVRRPIVTAAINVHPGMEIMHEDCAIRSNGKRISKTAWTPIDAVLHRTFEGSVYSLEVENSHTYFADGILTHNCWRGAVDALQKVKADPYYLTQSFRFGPEIASVANVLLSTFFGETRSLEGLGQSGNILNGNVNPMPPTTYLSRTNAHLFSQACVMAGRLKIYTPSGVYGSLPLFDDVMNVYNLWRGLKAEIRDPELKHFDDYWELLEFVKTGNADPNYNVAVAVVEKYQDNVPVQIENIRKSLVPTPAQAQVTLITAHRAKGLEWDNVVLCNDFCPLFDEETHKLKDIGPCRKTHVPADEVNLLYVAATRAKRNLKPNADLEQLIKIRS